MDSDNDAADAIGVSDGVEEHEYDDEEEEDESASEIENESEISSSDESAADDRAEMENLIRRLKENDETLSRVWADSGDELRQVCAAVQEENSITHFSICDKRGVVIDLNAASVITTALAKMPRLSHFHIEGCNDIDFEAAAMLAAYLSNKSSIRKIHWCGSNLGDRGAQVIAAHFSGNNELQKIVLARNNICDVGAIAIASLIESNDSLTYVSLIQNNIDAKGARKLAHALIQNQRLEELYLYGNGQAFSDAAATAFKTALYNDESIETIISRSNHTTKCIGYSYGVKMLIDLHRNGPERARRAKIIRFLNEQPTSLLSTNLDETLMPSVLNKVGRDCLLNTMFELVRNMPDLFRNLRTQPNDQCRKRSRLS